MDPTANLKEQSSISAEILAIWDDCDDIGNLTPKQREQVAELAYNLAQLVQAMAEWNRTH